MVLDEKAHIRGLGHHTCAESVDAVDDRQGVLQLRLRIDRLELGPSGARRGYASHLGHEAAHAIEDRRVVVHGDGMRVAMRGLEDESLVLGEAERAGQLGVGHDYERVAIPFDERALGGEQRPREVLNRDRHDAPPR